jgi:antibiotic biosynthesis monooxygenase (ABM) superfamily enzyme
MGLYPTVIILSVLLHRIIPGLDFWSSLLIGNLLSSFAMSYVTMPRYVNPVLGWWLRPRPGAPQPATDLAGVGLIIGIVAVTATVAYFVTDYFWTLP